MTIKGVKRVLLKISGEFLQCDAGLWSIEKIKAIVQQLKCLKEEGVQFAIVIGGGNIFRGGRNGFYFERCEADTIGMAATCVNALFFQACLKQANLPACIYGTNLTGEAVCPFHCLQARQKLDEGYVVIFAGGTGHPFFSTDTAAALRASEMQADMLLKATQVDGVFDKDPHQFPDAKRFDHLTYQQAYEGRYAIMDACAFTICCEQKLPIFVFNLNKPDAIKKAIHRQLVGTWIEG